MILLLLQIGDLFRGEFNWRGIFHLFLFFVMGFIVVSFSVFLIRSAFKSNSRKDD
jgi:hypothetical protein